MQKIDVAAYVWPSYTGDEPRSRIFWPEGIGEWQTVRDAVKKVPYDSWPRKPLWGFVNEADPDVMSMEIEAAADHGVNVFIYDWYWYEHRPFLEQCLDNGFLKASNRNRMKFYLMWANHDANCLWDKRNSDDFTNEVIWGGKVDRKEFEVIVHRIIECYFSQPNYYTIDGKPVFMIYTLRQLIDGFGGVESCRRALDYFREETQKAGFPGVELQACWAGIGWMKSGKDATGVDSASGVSFEQFEQLAFDSLTSYQFVHHTDMNRDYLDILPDVQAFWNKIDAHFKVPFYPQVSIGWDNNPRYKRFQPRVCTNNTPENFGKALAMAKAYLEGHPERQKLITLNSWNEWTETSFLEPDDLYGYGYLEQVKKLVF